MAVTTETMTTQTIIESDPYVRDESKIQEPPTGWSGIAIFSVGVLTLIDEFS